MKYTGTLIAITDIRRSKQFYRDVLGLEETADRMDIPLDFVISSLNGSK